MTRHTSFLLLLAAAACGPRPAADPGPTPAPAGAPLPFAGDQLGQGDEVFRGAFTPDGRAFYFFRKITPGTEEYRVFVTRFAGGAWSAPERVPLGGENSDLYPALAPDGRRMVFSSYRRMPGDTSARPNASLWMVRATGSGWSDPAPLTTLARHGYYHAWVEFDRHGNLVFRRVTPDWRSREILIARADGDGFRGPEPYPPAEELRRRYPDLAHAAVSPGPADSLLFLDMPTRDSASGRRASDIWFSRRGAEGWSRPQPLAGGVNIAGYDVFPTVTPDGRDLIFVRDFRTFWRVSLAAAIQ